MVKLIIANWKMHPATVEEAVALARATDSPDLVLAPPFPFIKPVADAVRSSPLAAQDVSYEGSGAFTGEVSAAELVSLGVRYVIVGHSERRARGDTDEVVAKKMEAVLAHGMTPILCVGETREEHDAGKAEDVVHRQLTVVVSLNANRSPLNALVVAYEPVWAISRGDPNAQPDTPDHAVHMIQFIRDTLTPKPYTLNPRIIYGGSVTAKNARSFLVRAEIEGALVGGASLSPENINTIVSYASAGRSTK